MLYISDKKFVDLYLKDVNDIDNILKLLKVASFLLIKYWKRLNLNSFLKRIKEVDEDLYLLVLSLKKAGK
jgi:hypothetical protein